MSIPSRFKTQTVAALRPPFRVLIADDDEELCALLADFLRLEGFAVDAVHDGDGVLRRLAALDACPDLLILDIAMPGGDGLQTLRELRLHHQLPVIILSARGDAEDRATGLEYGADDYLGKPCLPRELLARVRAMQRRQLSGGPENPVLGGLRIHAAACRADIDGRDLRLTAAEFKLLLILARQAGRVIGKSELMQASLGREAARFDRTIDVHVSRLRRKLLQASPLAPVIEAVRGAGYLMHVPDGAAA
ncbi:response regulator transcription factor [Solimonas marina]|uniref:Response regulator transcription factor n=1 Tax=Solimonas marina TaxID=2714601 RepID=A0A969WAF0_9GAMM|nr:response regulator transcription factor [Solimonas marina]NKF22859.1 response regulator transcription factor [Solimonas marina]